MNGALKTVLRLAFLAALIWVLAALAGAAPGATLQIGSRKKKRGWNGMGGCNANRWVASGMGAELVTSPGTDVPTVGVPLLMY